MAPAFVHWRIINIELRKRDKIEINMTQCLMLFDINIGAVQKAKGILSQFRHLVFSVKERGDLDDSRLHLNQHNRIVSLQTPSRDQHLVRSVLVALSAPIVQNYNQ